MKKTTVFTLSVIAAVAALALAQAPAQQTPPPAQPAAPRAQPQMPPGPNPNSQYRLGPDSMAQEGVPQGEIRGPFIIPSKAYPGTQHTYWVYVPAQYDPAVPASLMVFQDGQAFKDEAGDIRAQHVMDNLIYRHEIPVMIGVFINPGRTPEQPEPNLQEWGDRTTNRPAEYNSLDDKYARVITEELMPALYKDYNISKDPEQHGIGGSSSGAIAAFTVAWERPNDFRKVLSNVGSFVNLRGGHVYPEKVLESEKKPIRVFLCDGRNDNRGQGRGGYDEKRDWFFQNVRLMKALTQKGYDVNYSWGMNLHGQKFGGVIMPEMMRWLWRDGPVSTDPNDMVERAFRPAAVRPAAAPSQQPGGRGGRGPQPPPPPPVQPKPEELAKVREKTEQIESLVAALKSKRADPVLLNDVEVYAKAGRMLLEFPELFGTQNAIDHSFEVLDQGIERAKQLQGGTPQWNESKKQLHAYRSEIDGSVQPYGITLPANYDPSKPARLYVWLHGRQNNTTEAEFIYQFLRPRAPGNAPVADQGQIQVDCFGRINGAGWHWAGEADVFEAIAAVKKRYRIDDQRVILRGFSMGGEGAWHIALHYPDRFAAAEIGAGTVSRRALQQGLEPYQLANLKIWENISEWALNIYNLPLAGHDGEQDPGQLESSLRARAQLEKEGFPSDGERDFLRSKGAPGLWMQSLNTGHGTSPLVRQRLDAFLKEWGDKGQSSPDHLRFVTYTTRYNRDYWASVDGLEKHYERADIDARRDDARKSYDITTHNVSRLVLREMDHAKEVRIDGQDVKVKPGAEIALQKTASVWKPDRAVKQTGLHKTHALQGPIDDAFLDPFLLVRPTGVAWNEEVNQQALRTLARFDRMWAKFFRGHPLVKDDKDVTEADLAKYHVVLFGDPGSNRLIAKLNGRLPMKWTRDTVTLAGKDFPATQNFPAMVYPNPLNPAKYVVLNTGLTIVDRDYNGDYGMPRWGDYAIVTAKAGADVPDLQFAGLFDENWQLVR